MSLISKMGLTNFWSLFFVFCDQKRKSTKLQNFDNLTIACQVKKTSLNFEPLLFLYNNRANLDILRTYSLTCPKYDIETPWSVTQYFGWKNKKSKRPFFFGAPCGLIHKYF